MHRRLIQPTFHINILEQFLGTFNDASKVLIQRLKGSPSQLNITHFVNECVFDILHGKFDFNCAIEIEIEMVMFR